MPKKLPGITLEYVIVTDEGDTQEGTVRAPEAQLPFKAMRSISKSIKRLRGEEEPEEKPGG